MLVLYSIGPFVEEYLGRNKFYLFYIISGVFSAFTHMLFTNNIEIPLVGASGSIWGIIVMFAFIHKNHELNFMFIPINIKAKYLIPIMFLIELACCVFYSIDNVSHLAHVGGAIMGFILILIDKRYHVSN
jgi:membrane associated rhomboid family serine protease